MTGATGSASASQAEAPAFQRLNQAVPELAFAKEACLPARSPLSKCTACADACPVDALGARKGRLTLDESTCLRCGQCAAACPTDALHVQGFGEDWDATEREFVSGDGSGPSAAGSETAVDCWRVPAERSPSGAIRIPCLGGLKAGVLLAWADRFHGLALLDRGWCQDCPAGGDRHPAEEAMNEAQSAAREIGAPAERAPKWRNSPLPHSEATDAAIPLPLAERRVSRRDLWRRLAGHAASTADQVHGTGRAAGSEGAAGRPLVHGISVVDRERVVAYAERHRGELPEGLSPRVAIDHDACCNHRICASLCPTGALAAYQQESASGVAFDPARCITCRLCESVCPERALTVSEQGGRTEIVTRHSEKRCTDCLQPFSGSERGADPLCPECRKKQDLLSGGGYALLFGQKRDPEGVGSQANPVQKKVGPAHSSDSIPDPGGTG